MDEAASFIKFLQAGIAPIALISGVGLILLSLTNRLGRTIDRSRLIIKDLKGQDKTENNAEYNVKIVELGILYKRSKILRSSIACISFSILTTSLIIPVLLIMGTMDINLKVFGNALFVLSVLGIIASSIFLFLDIILTLKALSYEVKEFI